MQRCTYNKCVDSAVDSFAGVALCKAHYKNLSNEFNNFYAKKITQDERKMWKELKQLSYWSKFK